MGKWINLMVMLYFFVFWLIDAMPYNLCINIQNFRYFENQIIQNLQKITNEPTSFKWTWLKVPFCFIDYLIWNNWKINNFGYYGLLRCIYRILQKSKNPDSIIYIFPCIQTRTVSAYTNSKSNGFITTKAASISLLSADILQIFISVIPTNVTMYIYLFWYYVLMIKYIIKTKNIQIF